MEHETKPHAYILLGPPGSGKSTQSDILNREFGCEHIDMGSALRSAAQEPTPFGAKINDIINRKRELVPDEIVQAVLEQELRKMAPDRPVVVDGAPRRGSQIREVLSALNRHGKNFKKAIFVELSEEDSVDRISRRFSCTDCGARLILGGNYENVGDRCPQCGGRVGQRADDTAEGVRKRWQVFHDETLSVLDYFEEQGQLLRVSGKNDAETIFNDIRSGMKSSDDSR